ncbi:MAG: (E)-4-hydroxy-3-methylbut-2-enyl-diphosphate synthase [Bacteroidales bacterium]|nr:(E)-4-hydroxy-3-methylbut-2-enyl-diphosphate synthase [Bacteroidales bacterium]
MNSSTNSYCIHPYLYHRLLTREVMIGHIPLGGANPIRIQSMTNKPTADVTGTVKQIDELKRAGCDYVRITVPSIKNVDYVRQIKKQLKILHINTPIIADIHYNPAVAEAVVPLVAKVRINPGNFAEVRQESHNDITENEWRLNLERIEERLVPLIERCKKEGVAVRVGSNHGSLAERITNRYGNTPLGMTEAVMEYLEIFERHNFHNVVLSMKSSNVKVMIYAYRLLVNRMMENDMHYPLHLGVTEAGCGIEGRIKSAVGIGTLLEDGLGDTIRVSLTENPVNEVPVAKTIIKRFAERKITRQNYKEKLPVPYSPFTYIKRKPNAVAGIGGNNPVAVASESIEPSNKQQIPDLFVVRNAENTIINLLTTNNTNNTKLNVITLPEEARNAPLNSIIHIASNKVDRDALIHILKNRPDIIIMLISPNIAHPGDIRKIMAVLKENKLFNPVLLHIKSENGAEAVIHSAITAGSFFVDGLLNGLFVENENSVLPWLILQATGSRITATEIISCPSCGRTRFDIEKVVASIKAKTKNLVGLKIAVMGCVVNGPGEMADADYGYVGSGNGKVVLYKEKKVVMKNVDEVNAVDKLIALIKNDGNWKEIS